jgi:hypothetical protein
MPPRSLRCAPLFVLFLYALCGMFHAAAQTPPLLWQHCYGGDSLDAFTSVRPATDGGFIATGTTRSTDGDLAGNGGKKGLWVVKLDALGAIQWEKTYDSTILGGNYIEPTLDGGYIVTGTSTLKLDAAGNVQWLAGVFGSVVHQAPDSSYIISSDNYYSWNLTKLSAGGGTLWQKSFAPVGDELTVTDVCIAAGGNGYVFTGGITDINILPILTAALT